MKAHQRSATKNLQNTLKKFSEAIAEELGTQEEKFKGKVEELQEEVANLRKQSSGSKGEDYKMI